MRSIKPSQNKRRKQRFYKRKGFWLTLLLLAVSAAVVGYIALERYTRPYREQAATYDLELIDKVEMPSIILGRDGGEIGRFFIQNRSVVEISEVPKKFVDALRAGEDKRFYDHDGVDYVGIARAAKDWYSEGEAVSGASTITQQLARGAYHLENDRKKFGYSKLERKILEAFLAMRIEQRYQKTEILEFYLNRIYFGSGFYGIRSASLGYFGKEPKDLTSLESATIVGLIKNPTKLSPLNNIKACKAARNMVIGRMANLGVVTSAEAARMRGAEIKLNSRPLRRGTSHLYERIADEIRVLLGEDALAAGGFTIRTSIDSRVQKVAEKSLEESLQLAEAHAGYANPLRQDYQKTEDSTPEYLQGAVLMVDYRDGGVIAHVGGRDYEDAPFDMIELGRRPLGTAFHPFIYAAALEVGLTPTTLAEDEAMDNRAVMVGGREGILAEWGMETPKPKYEGDITLRRALESSKVAATVGLANQVGLDKVVAMASRFGLPMEDAELLPRLAVGWESSSLKEMVRAYSAFARNGVLGPKKLWFVDRIRDVAGNVVFEREPNTELAERAISDATAYQIHSMMQGGMLRGSAQGVLEGLDERPFNGAGKTGTTHEFSDNWFVGYNGRVSCGVWIGFLQDGKTIYPGAFARELAMPVWRSVMNASNTDFGGRSIPRPASIVEADVCRVSGQLATQYCYEMVEDPVTGRMRSQPAAITEFFREGTEKLPFCSIHSGSTPVDPSEGAMDLAQLAVIDASPVRPKKLALLGDDPYHTIQISEENAPPVRSRSGRINVLDSFDLNDGGSVMELPRAQRLEISPE